ncbi:MAG: NAD(P)H-hydrate dehydratase [Acidobacteria bacterium]|nr:NAD(P)H-hydrate dehydratase [Acidobacteriota bacterium]
MKVLTAAQMREVDRLTAARGIPGIVLMENAAHRVVEFLAARYRPLGRQRIVILCGKGNNGGDGMAIARQLITRFGPASLDVVLAGSPQELTGDAAANLRMLQQACNCPVHQEITAEMHRATVLIDALLGTGVKGPAGGRTMDLIAEINQGFADAKVVAVDLPSGMASDAADNEGVCARADATVTFTAPKICHVLPPNCDRIGELVIAPIGSMPELFEQDPAIWLSLVEPAWFRNLFQPRARGSHKGDYGHVLAVGGAVGKTGAAAMAGISALRAGAGLVTVAAPRSAIATVASHAPELMTEPLAETDIGSISSRAYAAVEQMAEQKTVIALGPGMGTHAETVTFVRGLYERLRLPMVVDADGLNALAGSFIHPGGPRILTPHPGEMARLCGCTPADVLANRVEIARTFAVDREATVVLKGQRSLIALSDGRVWVNPTGTPAMATGGSGDILTGLIAGLLAQFPEAAEQAVAAAVWLHGRAAELGVRELGEKSLLATDLLRYLPEAMRELGNLHD